MISLCLEFIFWPKCFLLNRGRFSHRPIHGTSAQEAPTAKFADVDILIMDTTATIDKTPKLRLVSVKWIAYSKMSPISRHNVHDVTTSHRG